MYKTLSTDTLPKRYHLLLRLLLLSGFVCLLILATVVSTTRTTFASTGPGGNVSDPVVRAVDLAEPAVVRIFTTLGGHLTVHFSATNAVTFPQSNTTGGNAYQLGLSGTGTFITAHGDVLTADHVINPPHDQSLDQFLNKTAASDVAAYINQNARPGSSQVSSSQVEQALNSGQLSADHRYDPATSQVILNTSYTGPLDVPDLNSLPNGTFAAVDRIEKESSVNDKDVAIVHVNLNDMPAVQLGDSSTVHQQDQLTIIGFPGSGDVSTKPTDLLTASTNNITVSSIKTTDSGAQVIQVGGNVEHGDSGGPALDNNGAVVGIVSFGLSNSGGTTFLQASSSALGLVQSLNLDTSPGTFQQAWSRAFADYALNTPGHWHKAEQEFANIATKYPLFKAVKPYLTYTQAQAKNEQIPHTQPSNSSPSQNTFLAYVWTIGGVLVLLALIALLFAVVIRRRGKKSPRQNVLATGQALKGSVPPTLAQQNPNAVGMTAQRRQALPPDDGMIAFGAPPMSSPGQPSPVPPTTVSGILRPWPCGHMNRSNARFCSICGEPAPPQTTRQFEQ